MSRRVSAARLAKKRANWRANHRSAKPALSKEIPLFPSFYYEPGFIGCVGAGHENIPHRLVEFTEEKYDSFCKKWDEQKWHMEVGLRELAKFFNLRDCRWFGLAGYIHQMMNKRVQISLIKKCVLADHLDVWKDFNTLLLSTGEWDEAEKVINSLINQN